jgi:exopolysaccharide biosynthesis polyprenyl glycosylphosphotransferase
MIRRQRSGLVGMYILSDVIAILLAYFWSYGFRFYGYLLPVDPEKGVPALKYYIAIVPLFLVTHLLIFYMQGFYKTRLKRTRVDDFVYITLNAVFSILIIFSFLNTLVAYGQGIAFLMPENFTISRLFLPIYFVSVVFMITVLRHQIYFVMKRRYAKGLNLKNVLIVGAGKMGRAVAQKLLDYKDMGFVVRGFLEDTLPVGEEVPVDGGLPVLGSVGDLESVLEKGDITEVYVALDLSNYAQILETLKIVDRFIVNIRLIPDLFQMLTLKARIEDLDGFPVISIDEPPLRGLMLFLKRCVDLVVSTLVLLVLSPLWLLFALLIKLTSRGPLLYRQERVGMDGVKFMMLKFRTMVENAEQETGPVMCSPGDPRITPLGRFLRKFSIDEIPQLINVLRREMSLIGPRPERPVFVQDLRGRIPKYMLRHKVKSGITGWAQVHGLRQDADFDKRLEYDFYYIQNWSPALDFKILWKTLRKGFIDKNISLSSRKKDRKRL